MVGLNMGPKGAAGVPPHTVERGRPRRVAHPSPRPCRSSKMREAVFTVAFRRLKSMGSLHWLVLREKL